MTGVLLGILSLTLHWQRVPQFDIAYIAEIPGRTELAIATQGSAEHVFPRPDAASLRWIGRRDLLLVVSWSDVTIFTSNGTKSALGKVNQPDRVVAMVFNEGAASAYAIRMEPYELVVIDTTTGAAKALAKGGQVPGTTSMGRPEVGCEVAVSGDSRYVAFNLPSKARRGVGEYVHTEAFVYDIQTKKTVKVGRGAVRGWVGSDAVLLWDDDTGPLNLPIAKVVGRDGRLRAKREVPSVVTTCGDLIVGLGGAHMELRGRSGREVVIWDKALKEIGHGGRIEYRLAQTRTHSFAVRPRK